MKRCLLVAVLMTMFGCAARQPSMYQELFLILQGLEPATLQTTEPKVKGGFLITTTPSGATLILSNEFVLFAAWGGTQVVPFVPGASD